MTMTSRTVGVTNACFSLLVYATSPIMTYAVPQEWVWHVYATTLFFVGLMFIVDCWNSDNPAKNLKIMKEIGISNVEIWSSAAGTFFGFQIPTILLLWYGTSYNPDWEIPTMEYFTLDKILRAFLIVLWTDAAFWFMHSILHKNLPRVHLLHHACVHSSQTTNLFFNPLDLAMEFTAPVLVCYGLSIHGFHDPWLFILCTAITQAWYSSRHDEILGGSHIRHHRGCATGYFVYVDYFYGDPRKERVRRLIGNSLFSKTC